MEPARHTAVMLEETLAYLEPREDALILDATLGLAGHTRRLLERGARVVGIDRDPESLKLAAQNLADYADRCILLHGRMSQARELLAEEGIERVDGVLADVGISMWQLQTRGFSVHSEAALDFRMDPGDPSSVPAQTIVSEYLEKDLVRVLSIGKPREARQIARRIVNERRRTTIQTPRQLSQLIAATIAPGRPLIEAAPYLMAIRAEANAELPEMRALIQAANDLLSPHGRLVLITFQSLEHAAAKEELRKLAFPCQCPPGFPECRCPAPTMKLLTRKPLFPTAEEIAANPASRSARLHAAERLPEGAPLGHPSFR